MAAGSGTGGVQSHGSAAALESTLDRRLQGLTNTMESIQGLSTWCIENRKYHSVIVRYWIKWLRKSDPSHRLNLFYLANDVIQNCKRRNAIIYRTTFTDVLSEAIQLVSKTKDSKVRQSVDRILSIWGERGVYTEELISELRSGLVKKEPPAAPVNPKEAMKSKIVAEFVPSAFIKHLSKYRNSMDEIELREKQLAAMRVDVCSSEALKKLKDKAGGKRFSKDFEDGSAKLKEFVAFLESEVKRGPPLMEALENADIFYELQYKEVKLVTKAYQTFANRVTHLKRKLDALKTGLPGADHSPPPSPSEDAPSPAGSESPLHGLGHVVSPDPDLDGQAMEDMEGMITLGEAPSPLSSAGGSPIASAPHEDQDNRAVEDMELSDTEEMEGPGIIVEELAKQPVPVAMSSAASALAVTHPPMTNEDVPVKQATPPAATPPAPINLASVDLGKISSILSTLTNVMKNTGGPPVTRASPVVSSSSAPSSSLSTTTPTQAQNPLANILSRVDINPNTLLSALSKSQAPGTSLHGLSTLLNNQAGKPPLTTPKSDKDTVPNSTLTDHPHFMTPPVTGPHDGHLSIPETAVTSRPSPSMSNVQLRDVHRELETKADHTPIHSNSLESKIDNFLQGNPVLRGYSLGLPDALPGPLSTSNSPTLGQENLGETPVRDEPGSTPTQDEIMDTPRSEQYHFQGGSLQVAIPSMPIATNQAPPVLHENSFTNNVNSWQEQKLHNAHFGTASLNGGEFHQKHFGPKGDGRRSPHSLTDAEANRQHLIETLVASSLPDNQRPSSEFNEGMKSKGVIGHGQRTSNAVANPNLDGGWYREVKKEHGLTDAYMNKPYPVEDTSSDLRAPSSFFTCPLPPIPQLPPPPKDIVSPSSNSIVGCARVPMELTGMAEDSADNSQGREEPFRYDVAPSHLTQEQDPFHTHPPITRLSRHAPLQTHDISAPQNGPMVLNYGHRPPLHHSSVGHQRPSPPPSAMGYHDSLSPHQSPSEDPYFDPYYDYPPRSPTPPSFGVGPPHSRPYHPEARPLRPPHPERRVPYHHEHSPHHPLDHRPPPSGPFPPSHPGHPPPRRPLPPPHQFPQDLAFQRLKRPGPPFGGPRRPGPPGGPFFPAKRPYLPPRF